MSHASAEAAVVRGADRSLAGTDIHSAKILVVDDEPLIRQLLSGILRHHKFTNIRFAEGGDMALAQVLTWRPDLVLLDMRMPDLDGIEVCRQLRSRPDLADLPILVQTAAVDRTEMGKTFAAGASDFLSKPINPAELISRVVLHLERRSLVQELRAYRERTSGELDAARQMQMELLPSPVTRARAAAAAGLRLASYFRPSSEIGGDIWGLMPVEGGALGIFLADFVGHGVTAALNTFRLHAILQEHQALSRDPVGLLSVLNGRLVPLLAPGQFATFLYVLIDRAAGCFRFVSAGAPSPIVADVDTGQVTATHAAGLPLGLVRGAEYQLHEHGLEPGARLVLFSDGLSEFPGHKGGRLGEDWLKEIIRGCPGALTPEQVVVEICRGARIRDDEPLPDDTMIICMDLVAPAALAATAQDPK